MIKKRHNPRPSKKMQRLKWKSVGRSLTGCCHSEAPAGVWPEPELSNHSRAAACLISSFLWNVVFCKYTTVGWDFLQRWDFNQALIGELKCLRGQRYLISSIPRWKIRFSIKKHVYKISYKLIFRTYNMRYYVSNEKRSRIWKRQNQFWWEGKPSNSQRLTAVPAPVVRGFPPAHSQAGEISNPCSYLVWGLAEVWAKLFMG